MYILPDRNETNVGDTHQDLNRKGKGNDIDLLGDLALQIKTTSLCGLGQPIQPGVDNNTLLPGGI